MSTKVSESYKGWTISITAENNLCAKYSFDITDPDGKSHHVRMGGEKIERALERAQEMIDMEISFLEEE